jgi:hypothetical protein
VKTRRLTFVFVVIAAVALVAALPVGAKEGVQATLTTKIPLDAGPGVRLKVAWTLASVDEDGQSLPFGASGVYVRLLSASGADAEAGFADSATGKYAATVVVPEGGIGDVEVGLVGWVNDASGTRRGDAFFPITNDPVPGARVPSPGFPICLPDDCVDPSTSNPVPGAAHVPSPGAGQSGSEYADTRSTTWILIGLAASLLTLGVLAVAVLRRRHARNGAAGASDRRAPVAQ